MKTTKFYTVINIFTLFLIVTSCVQDGDFKVPDITVIEPDITATSSVAAVQSALIQEFTNNDKLTYQFRVNPEPTYFVGYVVSSDKTGGFYKKLIVQDKAENPTAGIEILIDKTSLSEAFEFGRKVYVKLDGLFVSYDDGGGGINPANAINPTNAIGGKFILGVRGTRRLEGISATNYTEYIIRSAEVGIIVPRTVAISDFGQGNINTFIKLAGIQFQKSEIEKTFSSEANDQFDGLRTLTDCVTSENVLLQTSTFSSFKAHTIPAKKGIINAVLTKDFAAENYVLIINTPSDIDFTESRCDPFFEEYFETTTTGSISLTGWTNYKEAGSKDWESYSDANSLGKSARMGAFRSGDMSNIAWLITSEINFDDKMGEVLSFKTSNSFADSSTLEALISTDWNGTEATITSATWTVLPAEIVPNSANFRDWVSSGNIDLSSYTGIGYIAFKYTGNKSSSNDGTYELDDIVIKIN